MENPLQRTKVQRAPLRDRVAFHGHPLVRALHLTTIEITTEDHLTEKGDCIIGVGAERGCELLNEAVKGGIRTASSKVLIRFVVDTDSFEITARGDPRLKLSHPNDIVIRKSDFVSDRTLALGANAAAKDLPRRIVAKLRSQDTVGFMEVEVS